MEPKESKIVIEMKPIIHTHIIYQIHGQVSVGHTWNALPIGVPIGVPNKVEDKVVAIA